MKKKLGVIFGNLRKESGAGQKEIGRGLISTTELCNAERGEREIDYFTLEALFERLGKSLDKFEMILEQEEYVMLSLRDKIMKKIKQGNCGRAEELLAKYEFTIEGKREIHIQYASMIRALLIYQQEENHAICVEQLTQALAVTCADWSIMEQENPCLCIQELKLLLMIAYLYAMEEKYEEAKHILQWVESYVEAHFQDEEEKVKIYPHCEYLLAQLYDILGEQEKSRQYCINGKECLIKNGSLVLMKEYLKLEEAYYEQSGQADHVQICQRQIEAVALVNSIAQVQEETSILFTILEESVQRECVLSNEVIKELRLAYQWTQERLSEDICAQETLARIEKGYRSPNKKKYYSMLKRMGLERKKYYGFIHADDYQLYEKVRLYKRSISVSNWEKADELLQEIADRIEMDIPVNRQFVGDAMIHQKLRKKEITYEQAIEQLKELLYLTMPPTKSEKMVYRVPFRMEYSILNQIALCYKRDKKIKKAVEIYQQIMERYQNSKCPMTFHAVPGFMIYTNYVGALEVIDELEQAEKIGYEGVEHCVLCRRGDEIGQILGNLACVYIKQRNPELAKRYLRSAYHLFQIYERKENRRVAENAYLEFFNEKI